MAQRETFVDRVVAWWSPERGRQRLVARVSINRLRGYEAASKGRLTEGWRTSSTSADAEITAAGAILRDRMRDLVRNNPLAAQAVQVLVNNIVGTGIRPRAATPDAALNKRVDDLWRAWSARCDAHGHTDFHGVLTLAVREMLEGGDLFAIRRPRRPSDALPVPLQIELREADHLDAARFDNPRAGSRIDGGIEYDSLGRRTGYWLFPDHPGNASPVFLRRFESVRIPADRVAHLYERQRVQARGVPWGVPAMRALRDVDDWQVAELVRKKTEACMVGIVIEADDSGSGVAQVLDSDGEAIENFRPGMFGYARNGKDIKFNTPASTGGVYEWHRVQLHIVAAGFRVPYALLTGDLSQANFASSRVGLNEFRRMVEQVQWQTVIPMFCEPVWRWFVEAAQTASALPERGPIPVEWAPPRFESVNPLQDVQADALEVRNGFSTLMQQIARRGYDPVEVLNEIAATNAALDRMGLVLDSDPRAVTKSGQAQQPAADDTGDRPPPSASE
jgi:lambda family phage portal protein